MTKRTAGPVTVSAAAGAGVSGAATIVLFWLLGAIWGVEAPSEVHGAVAVLLAAVGAIVGGWIVPSPSEGKHSK